MAEQTKPKGIKVLLPEDQFGSAYGEGTDRQWVERRQRIGRSLIDTLAKSGNIYEDKAAFSKAAKVMANIFTDWTLEGDEGPLSKPWGNPKAFEELVETDLDLSLWVFGIPFRPVSELLADEDVKN